MKDGIILFLKENIIGRNLFTEDVVYKLENGKLEGVYSDRMIFSDLVQTENGFKFNMTTITHELIYNVDNKRQQDNCCQGLHRDECVLL